MRGNIAILVECDHLFCIEYRLTMQAPIALYKALLPERMDKLSWSITWVKEVNKLNFKLNFELKIYKN